MGTISKRGVPLGNLAYFYEKCFSIIGDSAISNYIFVTLDIDNFNLINKDYGLKIGDAVLEHINKILVDELLDTEVFLRVDSDIFNLFLTKDDVEKIDIRLHKLIRRIKEFEYTNLELQPSMIVYLLEGDKENLVLSGNKSYLNMKQIKNIKSDVIIYEETSEKEEAKGSIKYLTNFSRGIANNEFKVYYQVKQDLQKAEPLGAEALVRWEYPENRLIYPLDFIELLEKSGDIVALDLYVFKRVCQDIVDWKSKYGSGVKHFRISINISRRTLLERNIVDMLVNISKEYRVSTRSLEIEVTESFFSDDIPKIIQVLTELRQKGFKISVDDFGSGYSAFNILKELKVDILKIDKEFLSSDKIDSKTKSILNSIVGLGKKLKLQVTAEGVETKEQSTYLKKIGCDYAQGYYYSKPIPVDLFEEKYLKPFFMN